VDRDGRHTQVGGGAGDPHGDLAAVGDQEAGEHAGQNLGNRSSAAGTATASSPGSVVDDGVTVNVPGDSGVPTCRDADGSAERVPRPVDEPDDAVSGAGVARCTAQRGAGLLDAFLVASPFRGRHPRHPSCRDDGGDP
jgi:hypothetical protein